MSTQIVTIDPKCHRCGGTGTYFYPVNEYDYNKDICECVVLTTIYEEE